MFVHIDGDGKRGGKAPFSSEILPVGMIVRFREDIDLPVGGKGGEAHLLPFFQRRVMEAEVGEVVPFVRGAEEGEAVGIPVQLVERGAVVEKSLPAEGKDLPEFLIPL